LSWTSDDGATWTPVALGTSASTRSIMYNKKGVLVAVGDGGLLLRSIDQGQTWKTIASSTTSQLNAISFGTPNDAVAVGNDTTIIQSFDAGLSWSPMPFPYNFHGMKVING